MPVKGKIWAGKQLALPSTVRFTLVLWKKLCTWSQVTKVLLPVLEIHNFVTTAMFFILSGPLISQLWKWNGRVSNSEFPSNSSMFYSSCRWLGITYLTWRYHLGIWPMKRNSDKRPVSGRKTHTQKGILQPVSRFHDDWEIR